MTRNLAVHDGGNIITFDDEKLALIKRTIAKGATDDEFALFMHQAQRTGLDPLARQIHFQKYNTKSGPQIAIITGIDGYRLVADRTGKYAGNDEPVFDGRIGEYPAKATVTVWKIVGGVRCNFSASAYWQEYYPGDIKGFQWRKMPHVMLAKCAEAAALRKAFPADLSGVYTHDEMEQANLDVIDGELIQPEPSKMPAERGKPEKALGGMPWPVQPKNNQSPPPEPEPYTHDDSNIDRPRPDNPIHIPAEVDTNDLLIGKVEQPPAPPRPEPNVGSTIGQDNKIADARAALADMGVTTLGIVADYIVMTGLYNDRKHVANALNGVDGKALRDKGLDVDMRKNVKATLTVFDWAIARKDGTE